MKIDLDSVCLELDNILVDIRSSMQGDKEVSVYNANTSPDVGDQVEEMLGLIASSPTAVNNDKGVDRF